VAADEERRDVRRRRRGDEQEGEHPDTILILFLLPSLSCVADRTCIGDTPFAWALDWAATTAGLLLIHMRVMTLPAPRNTACPQVVAVLMPGSHCIRIDISSTAVLPSELFFICNITWLVRLEKVTGPMQSSSGLSTLVKHSCSWFL
jgi:hypothetical protein